MRITGTGQQPWVGMLLQARTSATATAASGFVTVGTFPSMPVTGDTPVSGGWLVGVVCRLMAYVRQNHGDAVEDQELCIDSRQCHPEHQVHAYEPSAGNSVAHSSLAEW